MVSGAAKAVPGDFFLKENDLLRQKRVFCLGKGLKKRHSGALWQVMFGGKKERFYKSL